MSTTVVIGNATTVSFYNGSYCVISANWGADPGRQDAFCLGEWTPSTAHMVYKPQRTASITLYAPGPKYSTSPSQDCSTQGEISCTINAATCDGSKVITGDDWLVNSYSYSKASKDVPAQETWSLVKYTGVLSMLTGDAAGRGVEPTFVIRGITQGQTTNEGITGITFTSTFAESQSGSVSAGSTGTYSETIYGVVGSVGGGASGVSEYGEGSASIPLTPMYI